MSDKKSSAASGGGIGFFGTLTILFIGLKLAHVINWSWWWVFAPLWMPLAILLTVCAGVFLIAALVELIGGRPIPEGKPRAGKILGL